MSQRSIFVLKGTWSFPSGLATLAVLLAVGASNIAAQQDATKPINLAELKQQREDAAHRKRRIIFNNDGDDVIYTKKEPTAEALLALRTTPLAGSQVDSIFRNWT